MREPSSVDLRLIAGLGADVAETDEAARARARDRLEVTMRASDGQEPDRKRPVYVLVAAAVAAVLVLIVQSVLPFGAGGPRQAAAVLRDLGQIAAQRPERSLDPGHYVYERSTVILARSLEDPSGGAPFTVHYEDLMETWIASDGSGRIKVRVIGHSFMDRGEEARWLHSGSPALPVEEGSDDLYEPGDLSFVDFGSLPTDPSALDAALASGIPLGSGSRGFERLDAIGDLLRFAYAPPEHRAALFEVAAQLPGVVLDGNVVDVEGRTGVGVSLTEGSTKIQLIFDEATSEILAERTFEVQDDGSTVLREEIAYLEAGIVGSVEERP